MTDPWRQQEGRDLDPLPVQPGNWKRIVACLNIWNDIDELRANFETWYPFVDHVIAVDGAYEGMRCDRPESTDGTREFLQSLGKVELITAGGLKQHDKRSLYFAHAKPGDLIWRIDADERIENAQEIRNTPHLDVGWIRYTAPIYQREQGIPAVFAYRPGLRYQDRHHWVFERDRLISTQQIGGANLIHRLLPISMHNSRGALRGRIRVSVAKEQRRIQVMQEARVSPLRTQGHEPLRVLQMGLIDPGIVIARLHSAINTTTPHVSIMATSRDEWTKAPRQLSVGRDRRALYQAIRTCDLVHCHINYDTLRHLGVARSKLKSRLIIHHHGTQYRKFPNHHNRMDSEHGALRLVSNLELLQYGEGLHYLPNPVPFARYRLLAEQLRPPVGKGPFRIAHSPTKRQNKGTEHFLKVMDRLRAKGLNVEAVLIERLPWIEALQLKASCHATFDSFWLGMQCSGLEAAAMGQPVLAGDPDCAREYRERFGLIPYNYANDEAALEEQIETLITKPNYYEYSATSVSSFVLEHHDYPAVASRYLDILDAQLQWRSRLTIGRNVAA